MTGPPDESTAIPAPDWTGRRVGLPVLCLVILIDNLRGGNLAVDRGGEPP